MKKLYYMKEEIILTNIVDYTQINDFITIIKEIINIIQIKNLIKTGFDSIITHIVIADTFLVGPDKFICVFNMDQLKNFTNKSLSTLDTYMSGKKGNNVKQK